MLESPNIKFPRCPDCPLFWSESGFMVSVGGDWLRDIGGDVIGWRRDVDDGIGGGINGGGVGKYPVVEACGFTLMLDVG